MQPMLTAIGSYFAYNTIRLTDKLTLSSIMIPVRSGATNPGIPATVLAIENKNPV